MVVAKTYYDHMITTGSFGGKIDPALKSEERFTDNFSALVYNFSRQSG
jgi:hypothetical protein